MQEILLKKLKDAIKDVPCNSLKRVYPYQIQEWIETEVEECKVFIQELLDENLIDEKYDFQCECGNDCTVYYRPLLEEGYQCVECEKKYSVETVVDKADILYEIDKNAVMEYKQELTDFKSRIRKFAEYKKRANRKILVDVEQTEEEQSMKEISVFLSYSHKDEEYKNELDKHLTPLRKNGKISTWNDRKLLPGSRLDETIKEELRKSDIIILLVSADFINSNYCYETEMKQAIEKAKRGECNIIPVIVRPCMWEETPLKDFLLLPKDGKPISKYEDKDEAYLEVARGLSRIIN